MDILSNPAEAPRADPHARCCEGWGLNTPGYPIGPYRCTSAHYETSLRPLYITYLHHNRNAKKLHSSMNERSVISCNGVLSRGSGVKRPDDKDKLPGRLQ